MATRGSWSSGLNLRRYFLVVFLLPLWPTLHMPQRQATPRLLCLLWLSSRCKLVSPLQLRLPLNVWYTGHDIILQRGQIAICQIVTDRLRAEWQKGRVWLQQCHRLCQVEPTLLLWVELQRQKWYVTKFSVDGGYTYHTEGILSGFWKFLNIVIQQEIIKAQVVQCREEGYVFPGHMRIAT